MMLIPGKTVRVAGINIRRCLPELSSSRQRRLLRDSLAETGKTLLESSALWLRPGPKALALIRVVEGRELVEQALGRCRGVILLTPHLGAWEAAGLFGALAFNMTCLYRPLRIPELEDMVRAARSRLGASYVPANHAGIRKLVRQLRQGGTVAMLPDQEPHGGRGIFAPFFGIPALTTTLPVRLATSTGAPIVLAWCERLGRGRGYRLKFSQPPAGVYSGDPGHAARSLNAAIENLVRRCPAQYQWGYRRFRTRPDGARSPYEPQPRSSRRKVPWTAGSVTPECAREQDQQGEDLEPAEQHGKTQRPLGGIVQADIVRADIAQPGAEVVHAGGHRREGGHLVEARGHHE
jgi:KDO2-lipid IV(A) lauroyltransferase